METVTLEKMKAIGHAFNAIDWAQKQKGSYPDRPKKPMMSHNHTSLEAKQYSIDLEKWEKHKEDYDERVAVWKADAAAIDDVIVEYIKDEAGLNTVPEQYRNKLYNQAYEDGHSSGYYGVFQRLDTLVDIFQ